MKRKTATTGLLAMGIVIALATLGLVIGNWTQTLYINGSVSTGEIKVSIDSKSVTDNAKGAPAGGALLCSAGLNATDAKKLDVTIDNAYPGYQCTVNYSVQNDGKLPFDVLVKTASSSDSANVKVADTCNGTDVQLAAANSTNDDDRLGCTLTIDVNKLIPQNLGNGGGAAATISQTINVSVGQ